MLANLAQYDRMPYEKRREASQATIDAFFSKASLPEASARDEPPTSDKPSGSDEPPASHESQSGISTDGFTHVSPSPSCIDDPDII